MTFKIVFAKGKMKGKRVRGLFSQTQSFRTRLLAKKEIARVSKITIRPVRDVKIVSVKKR